VSRLGSASLQALGTTVAVCTADADALGFATSEVVRELDAIDRACSRFRGDSELIALARSDGAVSPLSPLLAEALKVALRAAAATDGLVDPTIGASLRLAGYDRTFARIRARNGADVRVRFRPAAGWQLVELDEDRRTVRLPRGCELDLGATAKALAADRAAAAASTRTGMGVLVALGGDVAVSGPAPTGGWPVKIADDHAADPSGPGPVVSVAAGGLATSSTTVRRWRAGDREVHHLLDPRSGRPASTCWRTASVAAASCVDANTASTAAILLGEAAPAWLAAHGLPARLVDKAGRVTTVGGWPLEEAA
jgi:FAD:protein FMN transferase